MIYQDPAADGRQLVPTLPPKQCDIPGCRGLAHRGSLCAKHAAARKKARTWPDRQGSSHQRGYGARWRKLRALILERDPLCKVCNRAPSEEVDHVKPKAEGGDDRDENLQGICKKCHDSKTQREAEAGRRQAAN